MPGPPPPDTYPFPDHGWVCFHCGEEFSIARQLVRSLGRDCGLITRSVRKRARAQKSKAPSAQMLKIKRSVSISILPFRAWGQNDLLRHGPGILERTISSTRSAAGYARPAWARRRGRRCSGIPTATSRPRQSIKPEQLRRTTRLAQQAGPRGGHPPRIAGTRCTSLSGRIGANHASWKISPSMAMA